MVEAAGLFICTSLEKQGNVGVNNFNKNTDIPTFLSFDNPCFPQKYVDIYRESQYILVEIILIEGKTPE